MQQTIKLSIYYLAFVDYKVCTRVLRRSPTFVRPPSSAIFFFLTIQINNNRQQGGNHTETTLEPLKETEALPSSQWP